MLTETYVLERLTARYWWWPTFDDGRWPVAARS